MTDASRGLLALRVIEWIERHLGRPAVEHIFDREVSFRLEFVPDCEWEWNTFAATEFRVDNPDVRAIEMAPKYPTIADQAPDHQTRPSKISHVMAVDPVPWMERLVAFVQISKGRYCVMIPITCLFDNNVGVREAVVLTVELAEIPFKLRKTFWPGSALKLQ